MVTFPRFMSFTLISVEGSERRRARWRVERKRNRENMNFFFFSFFYAAISSLQLHDSVFMFAEHRLYEVDRINAVDSSYSSVVSKCILDCSILLPFYSALLQASWRFVVHICAYAHQHESTIFARRARRNRMLVSTFFYFAVGREEIRVNPRHFLAPQPTQNIHFFSPGPIRKIVNNKFLWLYFADSPTLQHCDESYGVEKKKAKTISLHNCSHVE